MHWLVLLPLPQQVVTVFLFLLQKHSVRGGALPSHLQSQHTAEDQHIGSPVVEKDTVCLRCLLDVSPLYYSVQT